MDGAGTAYIGGYEVELEICEPVFDCIAAPERDNDEAVEWVGCDVAGYSCAQGAENDEQLTKTG